MIKLLNTGSSAGGAQSASTSSAKQDASPALPFTGHRRPSRRAIVLLLFTIFFGLYVFQLWLHMTSTSATFDEPVHLLAGYNNLQCGDYGINPEHPPLLKLMAALPVAFRNVVAPSWPCGSKVTPKYDGYLVGAKFLKENGVDPVLVPARAASSLMSLLLAALVFLAAWEMFGRLEAVVALVLMVFEPNLIAHGSLVTTDMAVTATIFGAVYALYRYRRKPTLWRLVLTGLAAGLMLSSKHSGILMLPILFLLLVLDAFITFRGKAEANARPGRKLLRDGFVAPAFIILMGFTVLWAFYGFRYYALPNSTEKAFSVVDHLSSGRRPDAINTLPGKTIYLLDRAHVLPEAYTYGLADIIVESGTYSSVLGTLYPTARWFYFPVAFAIKSSIALLLSLLIALLTLRLYRERRREMLFLLVPAVTYFALSMTSGLNIGVRHILPVYPFFIVVAAAGVCALARKHRVFSFALVALLIFHAFTAARTAPNYIAFSNDLWGGTDHTHRWISDSNVDWGQNLKVVKAYLEREGIRDCWFAYFGPAELAHLYQPCHPMPVSGWTQTYEDIETMPPVIEGLVLISTEGLPPIDEQFESIAKTEPLTILGGSIKVYRGRFEVPLAAAFSHVGRGRQLLMSGDMDGAIGEGREAVKFAPEHPRMNLFLGSCLFRADRKDEARQEFETALRLAQLHGDKYQFEAERARQRLQELK